MLKRTGYIMFTSLLILSTIGFVVSRHYCENMLISYSIDSPAENCNHDMRDNCCHDVNKYVVLKANYVQPAIEKLTITITDVFQKERYLMLIEPTDNNRPGSHFFDVLPKPGKNKLLSKIQSYLL